MLGLGIKSKQKIYCCCCIVFIVLFHPYFHVSFAIEVLLIKLLL